jgi:hypothetical protein
LQAIEDKGMQPTVMAACSGMDAPFEVTSVKVVHDKTETSAMHKEDGPYPRVEITG